MWAAGKAGSITWLQFGPRHVVADRRSGTKEVGQHALHLDCPWRWVEAWGETRADDHADHAGLGHLGESSPVCVSVAADDHGAIVLGFHDGSRLLVEPDLEDTSDEWWRLFEPSRDTPHFVVGPTGIEPGR